MNSAACRSDAKLVESVQQHFLEVFLPLTRPAVEHEVELPDVVVDLKSKLRICQVAYLPVHMDRL